MTELKAFMKSIELGDKPGRGDKRGECNRGDTETQTERS